MIVTNQRQLEDYLEVALQAPDDHVLLVVKDLGLDMTDVHEIGGISKRQLQIIINSYKPLINSGSKIMMDTAKEYFTNR